MSAALQFIILFALSHKQVYGQTLVNEPRNLYVADTVKIQWHRRTSRSTMVFDALLSSESGQDRFVKPFVTRTLKRRTVIVPQQQTASQYLATTMDESKKSIDSTESPKISYGRPKSRQPESEPFNRRKTRMIKASWFPKNDRQSELHVFFRRAAAAKWEPTLQLNTNENPSTTSNPDRSSTSSIKQSNSSLQESTIQHNSSSASGIITSTMTPSTSEVNLLPSNYTQSTSNNQSSVTQQMITTTDAVNNIIHEL